MREFWYSSGRHLTRRRADGDLAVTDALLHGYLARPELAPPPAACVAERALHEALAAEPRRPVAAAEVAAIRDPDARQNWATMLDLRDRLVAAGSVEGAYRELARHQDGGLPALIRDQLTHLVLRNALDDCADPFTLRAGEIFFRPQRVLASAGATILIDAEADAEADRLDPDNAWTYWGRSDAFSMGVDLSPRSPGLAGFARAVEAWAAHLTRRPVQARAVPPDARGPDARTPDGRTLPLDGRAPARPVAAVRVAVALPEGGEAAFPCLLSCDAAGLVRMEPDRLIRAIAARLLQPA